MSLNLDKIYLPLLKILPCYEAVFGNLIFAIIARMLCGNDLNHIFHFYLFIYLFFGLMILSNGALAIYMNLTK